VVQINEPQSEKCHPNGQCLELGVGNPVSHKKKKKTPEKHPKIAQHNEYQKDTGQN